MLLKRSSRADTSTERSNGRVWSNRGCPADEGKAVNAAGLYLPRHGDVHGVSGGHCRTEAFRGRTHGSRKTISDYIRTGRCWCGADRNGYRPVRQGERTLLQIARIYRRGNGPDDFSSDDASERPARKPEHHAKGCCGGDPRVHGREAVLSKERIHRLVKLDRFADAATP